MSEALELALAAAGIDVRVESRDRLAILTPRAGAQGLTSEPPASLGDRPRHGARLHARRVGVAGLNGLTCASFSPPTSTRFCAHVSMLLPARCAPLVQLFSWSRRTVCT